MFETVKAFCDSFLNFDDPGFDLMVCKDGKCVLRYMNGYSDRENKIPMNGTERYNIYSCSKVITCTAALQLWEKGMFSLEDKLSDYMPEFADMTVQTPEGIVKADKPILIKHLFTMSAGLSYATGAPHLQQCREDTQGRCPTREVMKYLAKEPLKFQPGEDWLYSFCHDVLAALVEVLSGEKYQDYVKKHIFEPLGMTRTTFMLPEEALETLAPQYRRQNGQTERISKEICTLKLGCEYAAGGAGGISCVEDYMKFLEGLRTGKLLKQETVDLMTTDIITPAQKKAYWLSDIFGYGLGVRCPGVHPVFTDFGWDGWASAYMAIDRESGISIYLGCHHIDSPVQGLRTLLCPLVKAELTGSGMEEVEKVARARYSYDLKTFSKV